MTVYTHAGKYGPEIFMDAAETLLKSKSVIVYEHGTTDLAVLYSDRSKTSTAPNPFSIDSRGNGSFYANPAEYDLVYGGNTLTVSVPIDFDDLGSGSPGTPGQPGGGFAIGYIFSSTTTDADPGSGRLRLNNATQNIATTIRADLADDDGVNVTTLLDLIDDSTSASKGIIRLFDLVTPTNFIVFTVSSVASPSGYRNISVTPIAWSSVNPFVNGVTVIATFSATGYKGDPGLDGADSTVPGPIGVPGAGTQKFVFSTTTADADPGTNKIRLNNATPASATFLYIDDLSVGSVDLGPWYATWDDSTSLPRGYVEITNDTGSAIYIFSVGASVVDGVGYWKIPLTYVAGGGTFTNNEEVFVRFIRTGDQGDGAALAAHAADTSTHGFSDGTKIIQGDGSFHFVIVLTSAAYAALSPPDSDTWYVVVDP